MAREFVEDSVTMIRRKERELMEKEDDYFRHKRLLEEKEADLDDRRRRLSHQLIQEQEKMTLLLRRYQAHHDEASDFYRDIQGLQEESEEAYRQSVRALDEKKAEIKHAFHLERERLEIELQSLRREEDRETD